MPPTMLAPVPTKPRSNPFRRRRGAAPLLLDQAATAAAAAEGKRPAESSTSASSSFYSEVISASSTSLAAYQRPEKRPRRQDADEARPAGSECSQVIGGARAHPAEVEASESSCLSSVLESNLACPERLADDAEATEYSSACEELTPSEPEEEEVLSGPCLYADYSLSPLISSPLTDDDDAGAPSPTFNLFLNFAERFVRCVHPQAHARTNAAHDFLTGRRFEDLDDEESYERFRRRERREAVACDYTGAYISMPGSYGPLVVEQRVVMVNWIIEVCILHSITLSCVYVAKGCPCYSSFLSVNSHALMLVPDSGFLELNISVAFSLNCTRVVLPINSIACTLYSPSFLSLFQSNKKKQLQRMTLPLQWQHSNLNKLQPVTTFMGIGLMDRFLTQGYMMGLRNLQLLGIACITLAIRIEENQPYNCVLQKTFTVGINTYSRSEVVAMEWLVQEVLNFKCFVTTTHHFLWFYLKAAKADDRVEDLANYLSSLSLLNHKQLSFWPSTVAAAVVALACLATGNDSSCHLVMEVNKQTHMRTQDDDLPECLMSLEWLIKYAS
ncbi:hypothetical protein HU200_025362 [Digitaria exilis]|uniref:Cyclin-like domain-containing protein n=1 Tax=Digitaria exilis TaxID=1010633 RepID=A0A835EVC5_9POAL|nr:hypothetical protein HU200_025362 [Digitaria exilis]